MKNFIAYIFFAFSFMALISTIVILIQNNVIQCQSVLIIGLIESICLYLIANRIYKATNI